MFRLGGAHLSEMPSCHWMDSVESSGISIVGERVRARMVEDTNLSASKKWVLGTKWDFALTWILGI